MKQQGILKTIITSLENRANRASTFLGGSFNSFLYSKIERINKAVYLATNHIKDSEPVKLSIRSESISLVQFILDIHNGELNKREEAINQSIKGLVKLQSLIELLVITDYIKDTNYALIVREIENVLSNLLDKHGQREKEMSFKTDLFSVEKDIILKDINQKDINLNNKRQEVNVLNKKEELIDKSFLSEKPNYSKKRLKSLEREEEVNKRRNVIIDALKLGRPLMIKDIIVLLPKYSGKTIQRELQSLMTEGFVLKSGKRRWTKYSLKEGLGH